MGIGAATTLGDPFKNSALLYGCCIPGKLEKMLKNNTPSDLLETSLPGAWVVECAQ
jgi:hypothetical protein